MPLHSDGTTKKHPEVLVDFVAGQRKRTKGEKPEHQMPSGLSAETLNEWVVILLVSMQLQFEEMKYLVLLFSLIGIESRASWIFQPLVPAGANAALCIDHVSNQMKVAAHRLEIPLNPRGLSWTVICSLPKDLESRANYDYQAGDASVSMSNRGSKL